MPLQRNQQTLSKLEIPPVVLQWSQKWLLMLLVQTDSISFFVMLHKLATFGNCGLQSLSSSIWQLSIGQFHFVSEVEILKDLCHCLRIWGSQGVGEEIISLKFKRLNAKDSKEMTIFTIIFPHQLFMFYPVLCRGRMLPLCTTILQNPNPYICVNKHNW